ncbi:HelD family protein [Allostreptomyces psammosilenae]|uniref:HelD family protein n=1 Tax=Allostreptomyces psammosilenae TaxID=1892865 RepID=UPI0028AF707E|nr:AAA family ATPase [Allostreptomyces psammosilenae]
MGGSPERRTEQRSVRERETETEQRYLDHVYRRLEVKLVEAERLLADVGRGAQVGTPGALAERDAQVFQAGLHLHRLNSEFEDFLFGRIDLVAEDAPDTPAIAETLRIGRLGVLDTDFTSLVVDWRAPAAAPFYRATPLEPGRVVRRRVIRSRGRRVIGVEDDLLRPELAGRIPGGLPVVGDGALMAALGRARGHAMRDIVASIQAEQDVVIRASARGVTLVTGGPGTGKTAVALHRAAYLLYQDRRRYAGGILVVSPTPLLVAYTEGVLPSLGEEGQVAVRALGQLVPGAEATAYDTPAVARIKGSTAMVNVLRRAARGTLELPPPGGRVPDTLSLTAFGQRLRLDARQLTAIRRRVLDGTSTPVNMLRPRARRALLDALWQQAAPSARDLAALRAAAGSGQVEELRAAFDEDLRTEGAFVSFLEAWWPALTPRRVLAAMADRRRLGRWSRRILTPEQSDLVADSLAGRLAADGTGALTTHDIALMDELRALLGEVPAESRPREIDPLDQYQGLDEVTTYADRTAPRRRRPEPEEERTEYAHLIVDEAQDITPMQWRMLGRRGAAATWTVVGDPAQSSWEDPAEARRAMDTALGSRSRQTFTLTTNYRNPAEIAELAETVLRRAAPGTPAPRAVRSTGVRPRFAAVPAWAGDDGGEPLAEAVREQARRLLAEVEGTVGVVVPMAWRERAAAWLADLGDRVVALGSLEAKGLEYDATAVLAPAVIAAESAAGLRVLYVALTRATQQLVVLSVPEDSPDATGVPALLREEGEGEEGEA